MRITIEQALTKLQELRKKKAELLSEISSLTTFLKKRGVYQGKKNLDARNRKIYRQWKAGISVSVLAEKFKLSNGRIRGIYQREEYKRNPDVLERKQKKN